MDFIPMHAWHPLIVHFPLGLLLGGAGVEAAGWLMRRPALRRAGLALLTGGVLLAIPAIATGLVAYNQVDHSSTAHTLMKLHRNLMLVSIGLFGVVVVWRWRAGERVTATTWGRFLYATTLATAAGVLVVGSDRGAALVYTHATGIASERLEGVLHERDDEHGHPGGAMNESPARRGNGTADHQSEVQPTHGLIGVSEPADSALERSDSTESGNHAEPGTEQHSH